MMKPGLHFTIFLADRFRMPFSESSTSHLTEKGLQYMHDDYYKGMKDWHPKEESFSKPLYPLSEDLEDRPLFKLRGIGSLKDFVKCFNVAQFETNFFSEIAFRPFFETHFDSYQKILNEIVIPHLFRESKGSLNLFEYENKENETNCRVKQGLEKEDEMLVGLVFDRISHTILQAFSDYSSYLSFNSFIRTHYCKELK